VRFVEELGK